MTQSPLRCRTSIIRSSAWVQASSSLSISHARTWPWISLIHRNLAIFRASFYICWRCKLHISKLSPSISSRKFHRALQFSLIETCFTLPSNVPVITSGSRLSRSHFICIDRSVGSCETTPCTTIVSFWKFRRKALFWPLLYLLMRHCVIWRSQMVPVDISNILSSWTLRVTMFCDWTSCLSLVHKWYFQFQTVHSSSRNVTYI